MSNIPEATPQFTVAAVQDYRPMTQEQLAALEKLAMARVYMERPSTNQYGAYLAAHDNC